MDIYVRLRTGTYTIQPVAGRYVENRTGFINRMHSHPVYHLMYIAGGEGTFDVNHSVTRAATGMLYMISPNEPHRFEASQDRPMSNYAATFVLRDEDGKPADIPFFDLIEEYAGTSLPASVRRSPCSIPTYLQHEVAEGFRQAIEQGESPSRDVDTKLRIIGLIFRLADVMSRIGRAQSGRSQRSAVAKLLQFIETNLHRPLTLEELADHIHVTPNYLCRMFKRETGASPRQYVQRLRMEKAMERLVYTEETVYAIAEQLGYESASYFSRVFRAEQGVPPSVFRALEKG
jgi:AraC-like DNA-binding protein